MSTAHGLGLKSVFHAGLALALGSVVAAAVMGKWSQSLAWLDYFPFIYAGLGVAHVMILAATIQLTIEQNQRVNASGWLYSAGFVHTLAGLGVTLAIAGNLLNGNSGTAGIGTVLLPMGAAVLPHALAVWLGHTFEYGGTSVSMSFEESIVRALADESIGARQALRKLYDERLDSLRQEVQELQNHLRLMEELRGQTTALAMTVQGEIDKVRKAAADLAQGLAGPADRIAKALEAGAVAMNDARGAADTLRGAIGDASRSQTGFASEVRAATAVVGDLKKLQQSIVELLSSAVFRQEGRPAA